MTLRPGTASPAPMRRSWALSLTRSTSASSPFCRVISASTSRACDYSTSAAVTDGWRRSVALGAARPRSSPSRGRYAAASTANARAGDPSPHGPSHRACRASTRARSRASGGPSPLLLPSSAGAEGLAASKRRRQPSLGPYRTRYLEGDGEPGLRPAPRAPRTATARKHFYWGPGATARARCPKTAYRFASAFSTRCASVGSQASSVANTCSRSPRTAAGSCRNDRSRMLTFRLTVAPLGSKLLPTQASIIAEAERSTDSTSKPRISSSPPPQAPSENKRAARQANTATGLPICHALSEKRPTLRRSSVPARLWPDAAGVLVASCRAGQVSQRADLGAQGANCYPELGRVQSLAHCRSVAPLPQRRHSGFSV